MARTILIGGQFGDEGKGKIISHLALSDKPEIIARGGVGPNAGHTIIYKGTTYKLRELPSGFVYDKARVLIGAGVLISPEVFLKEIGDTGVKDRVGIDKRCTVITQAHIDEDAATGGKIGTTKTGCGPANVDRVRRIAKLVSEVPELKEYMTDVPKEVNSSKNVLVEGSQGFMLSLFYGTYPFVTSKDTSASTIAADVGLGPTSIDDVVLVLKSYTTRVGNGPFKDEVSHERAVELGYAEYGTVTGRPRRVSENLHWDDLKYACEINSATMLAVTKLDVRFKSCKGVKEYSKLPKEAVSFIEDIEKRLGVPVKLIGTGPDAMEIIDRR
ncbi:MAG: adenylosuccinate synthetase [Candidatus Micrarchaeota archaeon]